MHRRHAPLAALFAASALFAVSCGEPPRSTPGGAGAGAPSGGHPPMTDSNGSGVTGSIPIAGAGAEQGEPIHLRGEVRVLGDLAVDVPADAALFVNLKVRGGPTMPLLSKKADLASVTTDADGALVVPFELTGEDTMGMGKVLTSAQLDGEFDLEVIFDPTGGLMDKSVQTRSRLPIDGHDLEGLVLTVGG